MPQGTPVRRSRRSRVPSKKYSTAELSSDESHQQASEDDEFHEEAAKSSEGESPSAESEVEPITAPSKQARTQAQEARTRGQQGAVKYKKYDFRTSVFIGTTPEDAFLFTEARNRWAGDHYFPRRHEANGQGGFAPADHPKLPDWQSRESWSWYWDGGRDLMVKAQQNSPAKAEEYYPHRSPSHKVFIGGTLQELPLQKPFFTKGSWPETADSYTLNLGARVRWLAWAPAAEVQYLAVATENSRKKPKSAFLPSEPFKTCIEIWAVPAEADAGGVGRLCEPKLVHVVCANWGQVRQFKWCPFGGSEIGLLAGVWSDGRVRVIDVRLTDEVFVEYKGAAFEAKPPSTICTTLAWASHVDLVAGCSDGMIAAWNIADCISGKVSVPYLYHRLHTTYILSLASALPISPYVVASTAMDGYCRLFSLLSPLANTVSSLRARLAPLAIAFHPHLQAFIAPEEETAILLWLRRFHSSMQVSRTAGGQITCVSCAPCHGCVALGSSDGSVTVTNPMRRTLNRAAKQMERVWFRHEWAPQPVPRQIPAPPKEPSNLADGDEMDIDSEEGTSRFIEPFPPQNTVISTSKGGVPNRMRVAGQRENAVWSTLFEEATGATAVEWCPNARCGGWIAVGFGSGLLRIGDLGVDGSENTEGKVAKPRGRPRKYPVQ